MMRALLAAALAGVFCACAPTTTGTHLYDESFEQLDAAVSHLPASPGKTRVLALLNQLRRDVVSDTETARYGKAMADLEKLTRLVEATKPQKLELGFATAFKDWTGDGIDDGIEVYLTPRDGNGSAIKYPGTADVSLHTEGFLGRTGHLDKWSVPAGVLASSWNESLFPGYVLRLPWSGEAPEVDQAVLTVDFKPLVAEGLSARMHLQKTSSR